LLPFDNGDLIAQLPDGLLELLDALLLGPRMMASSASTSGVRSASGMGGSSIFMPLRIAERHASSCASFPGLLRTYR
jgi:hypothetical protein